MRAQTRTAITTSTKIQTNTPQSTSTRETVCPECNGDLIADEAHGETSCAECGLIIRENEIDHGPEWRSYSDDDINRKRTGAARTHLRHDHGLSTEIGFGKDGAGRTLSGRQRSKMRRLRKWNHRFQNDSSDRTLRHAIGEIRRMGSALGLPKTVQETAAVTFRRAHGDGLLPGRSVEAVASASLYVGVRMAQLPNTLTGVAGVSRVDEDRIISAYKYIQRELSLEVPPASPQQFVSSIGSEVGAASATEQTALKVLHLAADSCYMSGKNPECLAAAAIYAGSLLEDDNVTQAALANTADVTPVTIRNRYQDLIDLYQGSE
jgi:transcription initiation factor TFIIB